MKGLSLVVPVLVAVAWPAFAQDRNITLPVPELEQMLQTEPMRIVNAEISRPKAKGDITLKGDVAFGDHDWFHRWIDHVFELQLRDQPAARGRRCQCRCDERGGDDRRRLRGGVARHALRQAPAWPLGGDDARARRRSVSGENLSR